MRALNSLRTVSQLCRGNLMVSAVRGASSGPAGQLAALAAKGAARRASVLAMLLLVGHCVESSWRIGWTVLESGESDGRVASMALRLSDAQHHAFIPGSPKSVSVSSHSGSKARDAVRADFAGARSLHLDVRPI